MKNIKFLGKYLTYIALFHLFLIFLYGGTILYTHGNSTHGLTMFQIISGLICIVITFVIGIIVIAYLFFMLICFSVWSFKKDDRTFSEFVKGIF